MKKIEKSNITFSSDTGLITRKDLEITSQMSEDYFGMQKDPDQMPATEENRDWVYKNSLDYLNIVKDNGKIIGFAFMLPCNKILMQDFISGKISEAKLVEGIKSLKLKNPSQTIYLCSSILDEEYRGKGLATLAFIKSIDKVTSNKKHKPILFYWGYSEEGKRLVERIANLTGLEVRSRIV